VSKALSQYMARIGRAGGVIGGKERAMRLTQDRRREIAIAAADKRWADGRCRRRAKRMRCRLPADGHGAERCEF
jgi:hypothetical protein